MVFCFSSFTPLNSTESGVADPLSATNELYTETRSPGFNRMVLLKSFVQVEFKPSSVFVFADSRSQVTKMVSV